MNVKQASSISWGKLATVDQQSAESMLPNTQSIKVSKPSELAEEEQLVTQDSGQTHSHNASGAILDQSRNTTNYKVPDDISKAYGFVQDA